LLGEAAAELEELAAGVAFVGLPDAEESSFSEDPKPGLEVAVLPVPVPVAPDAVVLKPPLPKPPVWAVAPTA
jgi:hypothetical protein